MSPIRSLIRSKIRSLLINRGNIVHNELYLNVE